MKKELTRKQAIKQMRKVLLDVVDTSGEHSMCWVNARSRTLCRGFARFSDEELWERYGWIAERHGVKSREELEKLADQWQVQRKKLRRKKLSCDMGNCETDVCSGWDSHTNEALEEFYLCLCDRPVQIVESKLP